MQKQECTDKSSMNWQYVKYTEQRLDISKHWQVCMMDKY